VSSSTRGLANHTTLPNEQAEFVEWLKLGTREAREAKGEPPTISHYAVAKKVSRATLQSWKNLPDVKRAVTDHGVSLFTVDELRAARDKLVDRAVNEGNTAAIKMMFDLAGVTPQRTTQTPDAPSPSALTELSDAELAAQMEALDAE
jgi:hypothetical protein